MAGTRDENLESFALVDHIVVVSSETQQCVPVPVGVIGPFGELAALATPGAAWFDPNAVRDDLRLVLGRAADADRPTIEVALSEADYACRYGAGMAVVPPPAN